MQKLRHSRFAKLSSGTLFVIFAFIIAFNIFASVFLMRENLYYANHEQLQQKVYSYIYNYTASDLMQYLRLVENCYCNNDSYENYHNAEIGLYKSKYSSDKSSIHFEICDDKGNIILQNDEFADGKYFSFSSYFITDTNKNVFSNISSIPETTIYDEIVTDFSDYNTEHEKTTIKETTDSLSDELSTTAIYSNSDESEIQASELSVAVLIENTHSGNKTTLCYYYHDEIDQVIFNYCKNSIKNLPFDISEITLYQEDFIKSEETNKISERYSAKDDTIETKTFSTTLVSDNKTADISYSYNGSFYINEFSGRLSLATLILRNTDQNSISIEYEQKNRIQLRLNVYIPHTSTVNDIYGITEDFIGITVFYRDNIVFFTILAILIFIAATIFTIYSAGYIPGYDKPVAKGFHAIHFDILLVVFFMLLCFCGILFTSGSTMESVIGLFVAVILSLILIYTTLVRLKTKTLKSNTIIFRFYKKLKSVSESLSEGASAKLKIVLTVFAFIFISMWEILTFIILDTSSFAISVILFFIRGAELPLLIYLVTAFAAIHTSAGKISKGNFNHRIKNPVFFGPFKKLAEYLNNIGDGINSAVEERTRSESLKTELITNVSHDLKTPLTSIVNYVDLLKKEDVYSEKAKEYINVIDRQSQRLKKLTIDIVEASKAATGNITVNHENLNMNVILLQTIGEYIERLEESRLLIVQDIPDSEIIVSADGRLLWRIIDNLMNNICKYSMPNSRVYISLCKDDKNAYISFKNISKNPLDIIPENLTERFVRGDTSRNTEGSGLGLSIANSLTELMHGNLSITTDGDLFKVIISFKIKDTEA